MNQFKFTPIHIAKIIFALALMGYLFYSFNGPKDRAKVYSEVEASVSERASRYAQLKTMLCEPSDNTLLRSTNSIRCQVKFLDGKVATVMHKLDARINSNALNFNLGRNIASASSASNHKPFALSLGAYESSPIAELTAPRFSSIIDSVYLNAKDKYQAGAVTFID